MALMEKLKQAEFVRIQCDLRFSESITVDLSTLLRLRRGIRAAAQYVLPAAKNGTAMPNRFARLLEPVLVGDPVAQRQYQKVGPAFALQHDCNCLGSFHRGDVITLDAVVWGGDVEVVGDFVVVLQALGRVGLRYDAGRFDVIEVRGEDSAQCWQQAWHSGQAVNNCMVPLRDGAWWLTTYVADASPLRIEFKSPARLLANGKPLFKANFSQLFSFVLRRVTSMLYAHCSLDLPIEVHQLLEVAEQLDIVRNNLRWCDWRELHGAENQQPLGGLSGELVVWGNNLTDLLPYLYLGSMMNLGKNAAYGAGCYAVSSAPALIAKSSN